MRLYVAGPMTGLPDFNYPAFNAAAEDLRSKGYDVLNPADLESTNLTGKPQEWRWYMRHAIGMVVQADGLAMLPGWENSTGARLEHTIAMALKLDIHPAWWWASYTPITEPTP